MGLVLAFSCLFAITSAVLPPRPHILFILIDDLGWNDVSYHGSDIDTPVIDGLANEGIILDQHYVQSLCGPSRVSLQTGRYPYYIGLAHAVPHVGNIEGIDPSLTILPQVMKRGGYQTHLIGKWDCGSSSWNMTPMYRGFDSFLGYFGAALDYYEHTISTDDGNAAPKKPKSRRAAAEFFDDEVHFKHNVSRSRRNFDNLKLPVCNMMTAIDFWNGTSLLNNMSGVYSTEIYTDEAVRILNNYKDGDDPLFLFMSHQAVHGPMQAPKRFVKAEKCAKLHSSADHGARKIRCGQMGSLEESIQTVIDLMKAKGMWDNTLVIFTSDNGGNARSGSNNWPLRGNKNTYFEGGIRVTTFVSGGVLPTNLRGTTTRGLMHVTDWLPTLASIAHADIHDVATDGVNQVSMIFEQSSSARHEILIQMDPPYSPTKFRGIDVIRKGKWKLMVGQPNCTDDFDLWNAPYIPFHCSCPTGWVRVDGSAILPPPQPSYTWLFNIDEDPLEMNELSEKHPEIVADLKDRLSYYRTEYLVPSSIFQLRSAFDRRSCPLNFNPPGWFPWL